MIARLMPSRNLPVGAIVSVWPRSDFTAAAVLPTGAPPVTAVAFSGRMGPRGLVVTGLTEGLLYVAHCSVRGENRYTLLPYVESGAAGTRALAASATVLAGDVGSELVVTAGASTRTITLAAAGSGFPVGGRVRILKADSGAGRVVVSDGSTDLAWLSAAGDWAQALYAGGGVWRVADLRIAQLYETYTTPGAASIPIPPSAIGVEVICIGGGGPGGSGARRATGGIRTGGAGGGPGHINRAFVPVSALGASPVAAQVGTGGTGGPAVTADTTNGNPGTVAPTNLGATFFKGSLNNALVQAAQGLASGGGSTAAVSAQTPAIVGDFQVPQGGASSSTATATAPSAGKAGAGGAGGSADAGNTQRLPVNGGQAHGGKVVNGGVAGTAANPGGAGVAVTDPLAQWGGSGGGGGYYAAGAAGTDGGVGGAPGGGGGGGAASDNGFNSGAGGDGARGEIRLRWVFQ